MALQATEKVVQNAFPQMKKYVDQLHNFTAPPQVLNTTKDLTDIQTKLCRMKQFAVCSIDEVCTVRDQQIDIIKKSTWSIFLEQNLAYFDQMETIKDTCATALDDQRKLFCKGMDEFKDKIQKISGFSLIEIISIRNGLTTYI